MSDNYLKDLFIDDVKGCLNGGGGGGTDGVSPTVAVTDIEGGHRVTVTDATGAKSFDVMDGPTGPQGPAGADGVTPVKGTDYWTEADKQEIVDESIATLQEPVDGSLTFISPIVEEGSVYRLRKMGKHVILSFSLKASAFPSADNDYIVATFSEGFIPNPAYYGTGHINEAGRFVSGAYIWANADGLHFIPTGEFSENCTLRGQLIYFVD